MRFIRENLRNKSQSFIVATFDKFADAVPAVERLGTTFLVTRAEENRSAEFLAPPKILRLSVEKLILVPPERRRNNNVPLKQFRTREKCVHRKYSTVRKPNQAAVVWLRAIVALDKWNELAGKKLLKLHRSTRERNIFWNRISGTRR